MRRYFPYVSAACAVLFILLTWLLITFPAQCTAIDAAFHLLVVPLQTPLGSSIFLAFTAFGNLTSIIAGLCIVIVVYRHRPDIIARLVIALLGATVSAEYIKDIIHRARPETLAWLVSIASYSYPSGHSNESMVFYGFLGLLLYVHATSKLRRKFALIIPAIIILLVGFSRIALNYHHLTDVIAGFLLGATWLTFALSIPLYHDVYHQNTIHTEPIERPVL